MVAALLIGRRFHNDMKVARARVAAESANAQHFTHRVRVIRAPPIN
jgi:hypothetical protein